MNEENPDEEVQELLRALQSGKPVSQLRLGDDEVQMDSERVFDPKEVTLQCVIRHELDRTHFAFDQKVFNITMKMPRNLTGLDDTARDKMVLDEAAKHGVGTTRGIPLCDQRKVIVGITGYTYCDTVKMATVRRGFPHPVMRR